MSSNYDSDDSEEKYGQDQEFIISNSVDNSASESESLNNDVNVKLDDEIAQEERLEEEKQKKLSFSLNDNEKYGQNRRKDNVANFKLCDKVKKGRELWKNLLHIRIKMEKCLSKANLLPPVGLFHIFFLSNSDDFDVQDSNSKLFDMHKKFQSDVKKLLKKLLIIHNFLLRKNFDKNKNFNQNDCYSCEENEMDRKNEIKKDLHPGENNISLSQRKRFYLDTFSQAEQNLWHHFNLYSGENKRQCLKIVDDCKMDTQFQQFKSFKIINTLPSNQVAVALSDFSRQLKKTHDSKLIKNILLRNLYKDLYLKVSPTDNHGRDEKLLLQTYSDQPFYLQLLKNFVEEKITGGGNISNMNLEGDDKLILNRLTRNKSSQSKIVERRASKGRKIRYKPIPQLSNFMTVNPENSDCLALSGISDFHDSDFITTLFNSLFRSDT